MSSAGIHGAAGLPWPTVTPSASSIAHDVGGTAPAAEENDDSASEEDRDFPAEDPKPRAATRRRILDNAQFSQWVRDQKQLVYNSVAESAITDESKSTTWFLRDAEREKIISDPREYQIELFERAKQKNTIAVLDTGTGKTLIAALLLRHTIEQELEDRKAGKPHRISFFLVDKVALVFQQYEVLKANLDYPVEKFHGDIRSTHSDEFWKQQCQVNMVIVCTAEILNTCLHHSFVRMDQINLMVFDEAHHTKKNHPYARIIKDFYATLEADDRQRPRILGMTASPVDAKTDVTSAAAQLEGLLHSEIATVADHSIFKRSSINRPDESSLTYTVPGQPFETHLWRKLYRVVGHNPAFRRLFLYSKECTTELGRWCADRMWQMCLTYEEAQKIEARTERDFGLAKAIHPMSAIDTERARVRDARRIVEEHQFAEAKNTVFSVSNKVAVLADALRTNFDPETDKCIIFVEQRLTVKLLTDLFKQPSFGMTHMRPGMLIGAATPEMGDIGMSLREQVLTMHRFRHGDLNCIFATSVGEEGIDIPDCNIILRFDLCKTMIQYIQSRGRARRQDSKLYHMVEAHNSGHAQSIFDNADNEAKLRQFCATLSKDRLLTGSDFDIDYFLSKEKSHRTYVVPSTGAKLTYKMSLVVLANFVSTLPHPSDSAYSAQYTIRGLGKEFECEVLLPDISPVKSAIGRRATSKQVAKCSAAFEMCLKLKKKKYLNDHLQSTFAKVLPAMRNAQLAISSKKRSEYPMRTKPELWATRGMPDTLYVTVFRLLSPEALDRPSRPLALLTRQPLPQIARFPLFFGDTRTSGVDCIPLSRAMIVSADDVEALNSFTLRVFKDVFSKEYKSEPEKIPYFLAPLVHSHEFNFANTTTDIRDVIHWGDLIKLHNTPGDVEWENQPDHVLENKFVIDPHDGSRKFYTSRRRLDLKPTDPELPGVTKGQHSRKNRPEGPRDIWNFSVSLWSKTRAQITIRDELPVVEAEYIPLRRNLLDEFGKVEKVERQCYLTFQTLKLSALPVDLVAMAYNLPAIIYRLDSNLIVLESCQSLELDIRPDLALEAMTKDSDNTDEHAVEQINLQGGMGDNYERLEFLGDSFLKMSTTIALFAQIPDSDEFQYHVDRMVLICNKNLFNNALDLKLEESIRSKGFNRRIWYPDGLELLKGKQNTSIIGRMETGRGVHVLADKSIADVCEALIGASYMTTYAQKDFDLAIQAVTKFVNHKHHQMMTYGDYYAAYKVPAWQSAECTAVQIDLARQMEEQFGYKFNYPRLLRSAFMHPSYGTVYERIPNYQRLEFLGDALLDMVCVDFLYHRFPGADPQWLTEHKMAMVSNQFLGCLCVSLGLQTHMLSMTGALQGDITRYVTAITLAREIAEKQAVAAGLEPKDYARNFWVHEQRPPKCLPDLVESYIGALFVDSQFDYTQVQRFFDVHVLPYFEDMHLYDTFANKHPVTYLTNLIQLEFQCSHFRLMVDEVDHKEAPGDMQVLCAVMIHGQVREHAYAASGRYAKIAAAKKIVRTLKEMTPSEFKLKFGCDCSPEEIEGESKGENPLGVCEGSSAYAAAI